MAFGSIWKFGADNSEYKKAVREMPSEMDKAASQIEGRTKKMAATSSGIMKEFAGLLAGPAILGGFKSLVDNFDRIGDLATRFGTDAESIQRVGVAAQLAGADIESVATAMTKAGVAASKAATDGGAAADQFAKAGINAQAFASAGLDEKLLMVARAFAAAGGDANKTNAIIEILGTKAGANLIPLISNVDELEKAMANASVASNEAVANLQAADDTMKSFGNSLQVVVAEGLNVLGEQFQKLGSAFAAIESGDASVFGKTTAQLQDMSGASEDAAESFGGINSKLSQSDTILKDLRTSMAQWSQDASEKFEEPAQRIQHLQQQIAELEQELVNSPSEGKTIFEEVKKLVEEIESLRRKQLETEKKLTNEAAEQEKKRNRETEQLREQVSLNEAKLRGDKEAEFGILADRDFRKAIDSGASFEDASNLAATEDALRRRQAAETGGGRIESGEPLPPTRNERIAEMRGRSLQSIFENRAAQLEATGHFTSAVAAQDRGQRAFDRAMMRGRVADILGGQNMGEAYNKYRASTRIAERMSEKEFEESIKDAALTPEERANAEAKSRGKGSAGGGSGGRSPQMPATESTLKLILNKIQERPILVA